MVLRISFLFISFFLLINHLSFAVSSYSHLDSNALVVSASALSSPVKTFLMVTANKVGVQVSNPIAVMDIRDTSNNPLFNVKGNGRVGIGMSTQTQALDVAGNVKVRNGAIMYVSTTSGQTNTDWRLVYRDDCNSYGASPSSTGWYNSSGVAYNTMSLSSTNAGVGRNIVGGYQASGSAIVFI